jgi:hypothetical protein
MSDDGSTTLLSKDEGNDFERWLFDQSNVMHSMPFPHQVSAWRADEAWRDRSDSNPYKSRA